jgi:hypothetical protein
MLRRYFLSAILFLYGAVVFPCNCVTTLPKISKEETDQYTVIFSGFIKKLIHQPDGDYAEFVVNTPYKGLVPRDIKISYDNITSCKMPFFPGDEWLIYSKKDSVNKKWLVNFCERSRKFPEGDETDEYTVYSGMTIEEELRFLGKNYSTGQTVGEDTLTMIQEEKKIVIEVERDQNFGTPRQKLILLICSLAGMIIIYLIIKRFVK